MTQCGLTIAHPQRCWFSTRILHCHGQECGLASTPPITRFAIGRIPHGNPDDFFAVTINIIKLEKPILRRGQIVQKCPMSVYLFILQCDVHGYSGTSLDSDVISYRECGQLTICSCNQWARFSFAKT